MKTKLLKKIRKRILSIDYSKEDVIIKYLDKDDEIAVAKVMARDGFIEHWAFVNFMYGMFDRDSSFMSILKYFHERNVQKRAKKSSILQLKLRKKIEYKF